jgi:hypothetical protein
MRALVDMAKLRLVMPIRRIVGPFYDASAPELNKLFLWLPLTTYIWAVGPYFKGA